MFERYVLFFTNTFCKDLCEDLYEHLCKDLCEDLCEDLCGDLREYSPEDAGRLEPSAVSTLDGCPTRKGNFAAQP